MAYVPNKEWGTPHGITGGRTTVLNTDPDDIDEHTLDVSDYVTNDTRAIAGYAEITGSGSGQRAYLRDASGNDWLDFYTLVASEYRGIWFQLPLNADKEFIWRVAHSAISNFKIHIDILYY